jgi:NACHT domain
LQSKEYLQWADEDARTLWCVGIAGGGKSIFASVVVERLRSAQTKKDPRSKAGVACLFLEYERWQHQTTQSLTSAVLRQLVDQCDVLPQSVADLYDCHQENKMPLKLNECLTALSDVIERFSQAFLVVDALDECPDEVCRELMSSLLEQQRKTGIKILVTSRPTINFQDDFDFEDCKRLEIQAVEQDVKIVLDELIEGLPRLVRTEEALRQRVKNDIASAVSGMCVEGFLTSMPLN